MIFRAIAGLLTLAALFGASCRTPRRHYHHGKDTETLMRKIIPAAILLCVSGTAYADDCKLEVFGDLQMQTDSYGLPVVPVTINGTLRRFLLDTGGFVTQISPALVDELKLRKHDSPFKTLDVVGNASHQMAVTDTFEVGPIKVRNFDLQVGTPLNTEDGLLTPSLFAHLDLDLDFGPNRMGLFTQNHCAGQVPYWKAAAVAVVPINMRDFHINVPVTVEGHALRAIIDTGASTTFMDAQTAKQVFGLTPQSPDMVLSSNANNDHDLPIYTHTFANLSFEGVNVTNVRIGIIANHIGNKDRENGLETGSLVRRVDDDSTLSQVIIGMNVLRKLHLFVAFKEKTLYITPAGAPDSPSPFAPPPPKTAPAP